MKNLKNLKIDILAYITPTITYTGHQYSSRSIYLFWFLIPEESNFHLFHPISSSFQDDIHFKTSEIDFLPINTPNETYIDPKILIG